MFNREKQPVFYHTYDFEGEKRIGFVRAHDLIHEMLASPKKRPSALNVSDIVFAFFFFFFKK